jgi:hypothetical protein
MTKIEMRKEPTIRGNVEKIKGDKIGLVISHLGNASFFIGSTICKKETDIKKLAIKKLLTIVDLYSEDELEEPLSELHILIVPIEVIAIVNKHKPPRTGDDGDDYQVQSNYLDLLEALVYKVIL